MTRHLYLLAAVACAACNREKGKRHDRKRGERLGDVIATLQARRAERWRDPDAVGMAVRLAHVLRAGGDPSRGPS